MNTAKLSVRVKILAFLVCAALVCACVIPAIGASQGGGAYAAYGADVKVNVTFQESETGFTIAREPLSVHAGLAKEYGYSYGSNVKAGDITALDALVSAHILIFGSAKSAVNSELEVSAAGGISKIFGTSTYNSSIYVNGAQSHSAHGDESFWDSYSGIYSYTTDAVNQSVIKANDFVKFNILQDSWGTDNFVWLENDGAKTERMFALPGENIELTAKGVMNWYGSAIPADYAAKTELIEDAALVPVDMDSSGGWRVGIFDIGNEKDVSGADGKLAFSAPAAAGKYYYSTYDDSGYTPMMSPWFELDVVEAAVKDVIDAIEALPKNPGKGDKAAVDAVEAAYNALTPAQKAQIPADIAPVLSGKLTSAVKSVDRAFRARTVKFDANGGKLSGGASASKQVFAKEAYKDLPAASRKGYTLDGWYTDKSGGSKITAATIVTAAGDHSLYARWKPCNYKLTFNANGGKVKTKYKTLTFDSAYGALPDATRTGYTFKGWYTGKSSGGKITDKATVSLTKDHSLYARWQANKYKLKFDANGGKVKTKSKTLTFGKTYGKLPAATKSFKKFAGWYTKKSGGSKITAKAKVNKARTQTFYAHWKNISGKVVNCKYLNIRKERDKKSVIVKTIGKGASIELIEKYEGWYKVKSGKVTGWAFGKYIKA